MFELTHPALAFVPAKSRLQTVRFWTGILFILSVYLADTHSVHANSDAPETKEISLDTDTDIQINVYPASGTQRVIWIPAYATPADIVPPLAAQANKLNIEVWHADILEARFLPKTASSIYSIRENDIIAIINAANEDQGKKLYIFAESRAAIPVMLALRDLQMSGRYPSNFGGVIMNSPYFYIETPDPGTQAQLMPIASATNLPLYIIQPRNSPRYWQLAQSIAALEKSGSDVFVQALPDIRGGFLFRPDATPQEEKLAGQFGRMLDRAIRYLNTVNQKAREPEKENVVAIRNAGGKKDRLLQAYGGNPEPPPLMLNNLSGQPVTLRNFSKRVVLVNFWTTWCPPCVKEMPSLQRLSDKLAKDRFIILGVNIAEGKETIENFLTEKINVGFPILLDTDGNAMRQWNVMAFPTSFVIDKHGKIRHALFGSIDWDTPDITKIIQTLIDE